VTSRPDTTGESAEATASVAPPRLRVPLLKNLPFDVARGLPSGAPLPYRIDHLTRSGIELRYTDLPYRPGARALPDPVVQTVALAPAIARARVVLAMFESSAHPLGWLRHRVPALRRARLAVISCWLPELLAQADRAQLERYRRAYEHVDRLYFFSRNQTELLADLLAVPPDRLQFLPFGVDHEAFTPAPEAVDRAPGPLLAVGRDRGRDWPTLFRALGALGTPTTVLCRPSELRGLDVPSNVEVAGYVDRETYRSYLMHARAVLVVTHVLGYPTGQSVLLEAMASGRPCVVTDSPAIRDYVEPDTTSLMVPPHDADALVDVLRDALAEPARLEAIGRAARRAVEARFTAEEMWSVVARGLRELAAR
jgi:glycosyltransferase involved in cell wall biosynthesis